MSTRKWNEIVTFTLDLDIGVRCRGHSSPATRDEPADCEDERDVEWIALEDGLELPGYLQIQLAKWLEIKGIIAEFTLPDHIGMQEDDDSRD